MNLELVFYFVIALVLFSVTHAQVTSRIDYYMIACSTCGCLLKASGSYKGCKVCSLVRIGKTSILWATLSMFYSRYWWWPIKPPWQCASYLRDHLSPVTSTHPVKAGMRYMRSCPQNTSSDRAQEQSLFCHSTCPWEHHPTPLSTVPQG